MPKRINEYPITPGEEMILTLAKGAQVLPPQPRQGGLVVQTQEEDGAEPEERRFLLAPAGQIRKITSYKRGAEILDLWEFCEPLPQSVEPASGFEKKQTEAAESS